MKSPQQPQFSSQIVQAFSAPSASVCSAHQATRTMVKNYIPQSIKVVLPDHGHVFGSDRDSRETIGHRLDTYAQGQKLPYDLMVLEYPVPSTGRTDHVNLDEIGGGMDYDAVAILLIQNGDVISGTPVFRANLNGIKLWDVSNVGFCIDLGKKTNHMVPLTRFGHHLITHKPQIAANDITGEVSTVIEFLCALACSNTELIDGQPPKESANKKREKKGKAPFYTYKILTVKPSRGGGESPYGGTHTSPRVHLRRGHIRRLKTKTVWVNATVVGDKSRGMVTKDYAVKPANSGAA